MIVINKCVNKRLKYRKFPIVDKAVNNVENYKPRFSRYSQAMDNFGDMGDYKK